MGLLTVPDFLALGFFSPSQAWRTLPIWDRVSLLSRHFELIRRGNYRVLMIPPPPQLCSFLLRFLSSYLFKMATQTSQALHGKNGGLCAGSLIW